jgi:hypothetical protein
METARYNLQQNGADVGEQECMIGQHWKDLVYQKNTHLVKACDLAKDRGVPPFSSF